MTSPFHARQQHVPDVAGTSTDSKLLRKLADTATLLRLVDEWLHEPNAVHFRLGTITVALPEDQAVRFLRGLLRGYDDMLRRHGSTHSGR